MRKIIGITGGIGCGKTTVCNYLIEKGYEVISSDKISHDLTKLNQKGYNLIVENFQNILEDDFNINRRKLASIIFNDEEKRKLLNNLIHPLVKEKIVTNINLSKNELIFVDIPLLFEAKFEDLCDFVICVSTNLDSEINRITKRDNITKEDAKKIIDSQMPLETKESLSDFVIKNNKGFDYLHKQIDQMLEKIID